MGLAGAIAAFSRGARQGARQRRPVGVFASYQRGAPPVRAPAVPQLQHAAAQAGRAAARTASHFAGAPRPAVTPRIAQPTHQQRMAARRVRAQVAQRQRTFVAGARADAQRVVTPPTAIQRERNAFRSSFPFAFGHQLVRQYRADRGRLNLGGVLNSVLASNPVTAPIGLARNPRAFSGIAQGVGQQLVGPTGQYSGVSALGSLPPSATRRVVGLASLSRFVPKDAAGVNESGFGGLASHIAKDALDLPANAVGSAYYGARALSSAAGGNTKPLREFGKQIAQHDPVALALQGKFGKAASQAYQHPVSTALELSGIKGGVGRLAGRAGRLGADVVPAREPAVLEGTSVRLDRPYSQDAVTAARQVVTEARRAKRSATLDAKAQQAEAAGQPAEAARLHMRARQHSPLTVSDAEVRRRVDERVAANEDLRRAMRTQAVHEASRNVVPTRSGGHLVSLLAQNVVHADPRDIAAYGRELDTEFRSGRLTPSQRIANRELVGAVNDAVSNPKTDYPALARVAQRYAASELPHQRALVEAGLLDASRGERARLIPYAVRRMGATHDGEQIVDASGNPLSTAQIRRHMDAFYRGQGYARAPEPAYLPQGPNSRGARNFFVNYVPKPTISGAARTGEAVRSGTFDAHPQTLIEQAARTRGLLAADRGFKGLISEFALRDREGRPLTFANKREADAFTRNLAAKGERPVRPIRLAPFLSRQQDVESVLEAATTTGHNVNDAILSAVKGEPGPGPWTVIHEPAAARLQQHLGMLGPQPGLRGVQKVNQAFRNTVLPTSTKWITGNVVEAGLRNLLTRAGPVSYLVGRGIFKAQERMVQAGQFDPEAALEAKVRTTGGGHFAMAARTSVHRDQQQFVNSALRPVAKALGSVARSPGPRQVGELWRTYTHYVFALNGRVERQFQTALAGRYARDFMMSPRELSVSQRAIEQAARGLTGTNEQVAMGRFIDRAYGKYGKFNPTERGLIAYYTPFISWSLNAVKFVTSVLPRDHPVATALLASASRASEDWRKRHGLDVSMKGGVPGWLQGSIPLGGGKFVRASRYTPFGLYSDLAGSVGQTVIPQYMGAIFGLNGLDWKGQPLKHGEVDQGTKFGTALSALLESTIPVASQVQQVGAKKGPLGLRIERQFNPFFPVQNTAQATASGGGAKGPPGWTLPGPGSPGPAPSNSWTLPGGKQKKGPAPSNNWTLK